MQVLLVPITYELCIYPLVLLFQRLLVVTNASTVSPNCVFSYELCSYPPALLFQRLLVVTNASTVSPNYL